MSHVQGMVTTTCRADAAHPTDADVVHAADALLTYRSGTSPADGPADAALALGLLDLAATLAAMAARTRPDGATADDVVRAVAHAHVLMAEARTSSAAPAPGCAAGSDSPVT